MRLFGAALALAAAACATASELTPPTDVAGVPKGSAPSLLGDWISFYAGFESDVSADLAVGDPSARRIEGPLAAEAGVFGRAVRLGTGAGGARISYPLAGNLELRRPGGLSFWISPRGWRNPTPPDVRYLRLASVVDRGRSIFVIQRDMREGSDERFMAGFFQLPGGASRLLALRAGPLWKPAEWHLVAATWDSSGFAISFDGGAFIRRAVPEGIPMRGVTPPDAMLVMGDDAPEFSLLDELTVYARSLEDDDARRLWEGSRGARGKSP